MGNLISMYHLAVVHELAVEDIPEYLYSNSANEVISKLKVVIVVVLIVNSNIY